MGKVYLYSRVSTSAQTLAQQERTVYEWLNAHHMSVDMIVSDEGVSGGVSFADRKLGKELLPMTHEGDVIIVSEISRLGRSMFDLSKLIHTELKPRKLRLVVVSMGIDLRCDKLTAIDELILNNFSFAAQLEKQLISERTLSALQVKRRQGIKFGAASCKYQENRAKKDKSELVQIGMKQGQTKRLRWQSSRNAQAFKKVLMKCFPDVTDNDDPKDWNWRYINTKGENLGRILSLMAEYKEIDSTGTLFRNWDFGDSTDNTVKLRGYLHSFKRSFTAIV